MIKKAFICCYLICLSLVNATETNSPSFYCSEGAALLAQKRMFDNADWDFAKKSLKFALICNPNNKEAQSLLKLCLEKKKPTSCKRVITDGGKTLARYILQNRQELSNKAFKEVSFFTQCALFYDINVDLAQENLDIVKFNSTEISQGLNSKFDQSLIANRLKSVKYSYFQYPEHYPLSAIDKINKDCQSLGISISHKIPLESQSQNEEEGIVRLRDTNAFSILQNLTYRLRGIHLANGDKPGYSLEINDTAANLHYLTDETLVSELKKNPTAYLGQKLQLLLTFKSYKKNYKTSTQDLIIFNKGIGLIFANDRLENSESLNLKSGDQVIVRATLEAYTGNKIILSNCHNILLGSDFLFKFN